MSIVTASHVSKSYGALDLFNDISVSVPQKARIGLVGDNGVGKTTFLRLLYGFESPTSGEITTARNIKIGFLPQEADFNSEQTLLQECQDALKDIYQIESEMKSLANQLHADPLNKKILKRLGNLQEKFERLDGYTLDAFIRRIVMGLGFTDEDLHRPIIQFSGGERTRAFLAKLLAMNPDLLLLDEPTNHLDIEAMEWLEDFIRTFDGAVVIVSHDRYFLDQTANTIWEMTSEIEVYRGNYSHFLKQREERILRKIKEYESQQEFIAKEEDYIRRNIAGQNTAQAKGRRRRLERLFKEARLIPPTRNKRMTMGLEGKRRSGDIIFRTKDLEIGFPEENIRLFITTDIELRRGECVGVIGPNGAGKTTFIKTVLGKHEPFSGEIKLGASLDVGYFAQAHEDLINENTVYQEIEINAPSMLPAEIRNYLATYLFQEDDVFKQVSVLSGGERGRLALAILALKKANLIFLDEPTNHLDFPSQEILQSVLSSFNGTILLVTHDRYLLEALCTQIWKVDPEEKSLSVFKGTYKKYKEELEKRKIESNLTIISKKKSKNNTEQKVKKVNPQKLRDIEERIHKAEEELRLIESKLNSKSLESDEVKELGIKHKMAHKVMTNLYKEWEELF